MYKPILLAILISLSWAASAQEAQEADDSDTPAADTSSADATGEDASTAADDDSAANDDGGDAQTPAQPAPAESADQPPSDTGGEDATDSDQIDAGVDDAQSDVEPAAADDQAGDPADGQADDQAAVDDQAAAEQPERERRRIRRLGDVATDTESEWVLDIPQGLNVQVQPSIEVQVPDAALNDELQQVLIDQANNPSAEVDARLEAVLVTIEQRADQSLTDGNLQQAAAYINAINTLQDDRAGLAERQAQLQNQRQLITLQEQLDQALADNRLLEPEDDNAMAYLEQILAIDPENAQALSSRDEMQQLLLERADEMAANLDFEQADSLLERIAAMDGNPDMDTARQSLVDQRQSHATDLEARARAALDAGNLALAEQLLNDLIALGNSEDAADALRKSIADVRQYGGMVPGQVFRDTYAGGSAQGPVMMVMPAGSFMMGSPESEEGRRDSESPRFRVTFARGFALSQREITVAEFRRFIQSTGYRTDAERLRESSYYDEDTGRLARAQLTWENDYSGGRAQDDLPVVHVSWNDANAYAEWLADATERSYRLPSEAELEYAIRGGTQTTYWWGPGAPPDDDMENVTGEDDVSESRRRWNDSFQNYEDGYWGPAPVASLQASPFGLFDINGNVKEWTADCWHVNYNRAPTDGSAWINAGCESRVVRGADWTSTPAQSRSAMRISARAQTRGPRVGIRLARDL